jgi:hypothetical protein
MNVEYEWILLSSSYPADSYLAVCCDRNTVYYLAIDVDRNID